MNEWTDRDLRLELQRLSVTGHLSLFRSSAAGQRVLLAVWLGISSRETHCQNLLGDKRDGEFHGVGYVQVDVQHPIALRMRDDGTWRDDPGTLLREGAAILADCRRVVAAACAELVGDALWKVACSAYNCGPENAIRGHREHVDSDKETTGGDYGKDVVARAATFERLLGGAG